MSAKIAVIGSNNIDLVTYVDHMPGAGETVEAPDFAIGCGGKGANQAVAAARLGAQVVMIGKVGDDLFADTILDSFRSCGVDARFVGRAMGTPSGVASIVVERNGENRIMIVKGANGTLGPDDIDRAAAELRTCDLILLQLEVPLETVYHAIAFGAQHGIETILNPAPADPGLDLERIRDATFLVPNQTELALMTSMPAGDRHEAAAAAKQLIGRGVRNVIVTMGGRGALLVTADRCDFTPPVAVGPVDTTGAGDAFIGSFARFYSLGGDVVAALGMAACYAALSITRRGTQTSYATQVEFENFCRSQGI